MEPIDSKPIAEISIFDLDRTITRSGTWSPFLMFAAMRRSPWRILLVPAAVGAMAGYKARLISRKRLKEIMHTLMLGTSMPRQMVVMLASAYADHTMAHNAYAEAAMLIAKEQAAGRRVIIASAAHEFYLEAIAARLGVHEVIGTHSVWHGDRLTPRILGENCYGASKCAMLVDHLKKIGLDRAALHIRFYSDHISDRPAFDWADEAVAVNPSRKLAHHARAMGWPVLDWRQKELRTLNVARVSLRPAVLPNSLASRAD
jgi:HAD superfamily hydrolase (TIGR01490 family)